MPHDPTVMGRHILLDIRTATAGALKDPVEVERILRDAAAATGATAISSAFHHFGPEQGVTGVLVLAESHISIHTWPERYYAAIDIFVCGECDPTLAVPSLKFGFGAVDVEVLHTERAVPTRTPVIECCHKTRLVGAACPAGRQCPLDPPDLRRAQKLFGGFHG